MLEDLYHLYYACIFKNDIPVILFREIIRAAIRLKILIVISRAIKIFNRD